MIDQLDRRVAVVTGAGGGIGRGLVQRFAAEGMRVVAADVDAGAAAETASLVAADGGEALAVATDVVDAASVDALADRAFAELGQVDVLCLNAGVFQGGMSWERTVEDWAWVLGVNVWGVIHGIRSFVPRMIAQDTDGHVVTTASVAAFVTSAASGPYALSKFGAFALAESLAHDLAAVGSKIQSSVLCPSAIRTGIARSGRNRPDALRSEQTPDAIGVEAGLAAMIETGIEPAEVAEIVVAAIGSGDFVIPTKPSYADQIRNRFEALLDRRLPSVPVVD